MTTDHEALREALAETLHSCDYDGGDLYSWGDATRLRQDEYREDADALLAGPLAEALAEGERLRAENEGLKLNPPTSRWVPADYAEGLRTELDQARRALDSVRELAHSSEADTYRAEAAYGTARLPYASNRYLHLLDNLRRILDGADGDGRS